MFAGMLLELPASVVSQMLFDEALLTKALERAQTALMSPDNRYDSLKKTCELKMQNNGQFADLSM